MTDAGPLIHLSWIDRLDLFPLLFDEVIAPAAVRDEVLRADPNISGVGALRKAFSAGLLTVQKVEDQRAVRALRGTLDRGEAEAIVLMREASADLILLDDRRARRHAAQQGIPISGTLGILRTARDRGHIPAALPMLAQMRRRGFRISTELEDRIRREEAGG